MPNVLRAYTGHPAKFRTFTAFYNLLMLDEETTRLSKLEREMIAVVVSSANRRYYCLVAHGEAVRELSGDAQLGEMMVMNYRVAELDARSRGMLDFSWKLTLTPHDIGEADRQGLRDVGFSDADIFDICDVVAFFNYSNRMAHGLDMMPNAAYHSLHRRASLSAVIGWRTSGEYAVGSIPLMGPGYTTISCIVHAIDPGLRSLAFAQAVCRQGAQMADPAADGRDGASCSWPRPTRRPAGCRSVA